MLSVFKSTILFAAVAATNLAPVPAASAGDRWHNHRRHGHGSGDMLAAGVLGLAAGALIAGRPPSLGSTTNMILRFAMELPLS